ncbi:MAG: hypothetical protein JRH11_13820 [Deltaproteobacteria bacterium]|nr:hypothetical protein [Deltaproteobacteria bacterium]
MLPHLVISLVLLSACGAIRSEEPPPPAEVTFGAPAPANYDTEWIGRGSPTRDAPTAASLEAGVHGRYAVAPERALIRITVAVEAGDRTAVAQRAREVSLAVRDALSGGTRCEAQVTDLSPPRRRDEQTFSEEATLRLHITLAGLGSVAARQEAIEACLVRFSEVSIVAADIVVSDPLLTIDDPRAHRAAVLAQALDGVREVRASEEPVTARSCRSRGQVMIVERSLREIALGVDLDCG